MAEAQERKESAVPFRLIGIFIVLAAGIMAAGFFFYQGYEQQYRAGLEREISAITDMKSAALTRWRMERLGDAEIIYKSLAMSDLVLRYFRNLQDRDAERKIREWFYQYLERYDYDQVRLLDHQGMTRMSFPPGLHRASAAVSERIPEVLQSGRITMVDLYRHDYDHRIYISILIPVPDVSAGNRVVGVLSLRVDPEKYLYPFIRRWLTSSQTAETLLVRREGKDVLFLNDLKFKKDAALNLRIPLEKTDVLAVKAVLGRTGIVEGVDYRGIRVIGNVRKVPDSPWYLVTRMDKSEVLAPVRARLRILIGLVTALLVGMGAVLAFTRRQEQYRNAEVLRENEQRLNRYTRSLIEASLDPLVTISKDGKITDVNMATESATGVSREKLIGSDFSDYFTEPEKARAGYREVFEKGIVKDYPLAIRHVSGGITEVLYNASVYRDAEGNVLGVFAAARDITELKRAEEALHAASVYNRSLIEASLDPLVTIGQDGKITDVNTATEEATGYPRGKLIGTDFSDYFTDPEKARQGYRLVFREGSVHDYLLEIRHRDGRITSVLYNASVYRDERGQIAGVFAAARDITERIRAERAMRLLSSIVEYSNDAVIGKNLEGIITSWNKGAEMIFGYHGAEAIGNPIFMLIPEDRKNEELQILEKIRQGEPLKHYETIRKRKDGKAINISLTISPIKDTEERVVGISTIARDITERKRTEERLAESERQLRATSLYTRSLIEASLDPLVTINKDGKITDVNEATELVTGISREQLIGSDFSDYFTEPEKAREGYKQVFEKGSVKDYQLAIRHRAGRITDVLYNATVYSDPSGEVQGVFAAARDITERKKDEETIRASLREKEVLLKEVHHRVKNNMQVIYTLLDLQARNVADKTVRDVFEESRNRVNSMALIHEKLYRSADLAHIDFKEYLQGIVKGIADTYKRHDVIITVDMEPIFLNVNVGIPCGLIVNELVSNSLKHAFPDGRRGTISLGIRKNPEGAYVLFVADNGIGLPEEIDFRNTASLGLQLVNVLTGQIRGTIGLSREKGTEFNITFPAA